MKKAGPRQLGPRLIALLWQLADGVARTDVDAHAAVDALFGVDGGQIVDQCDGVAVAVSHTDAAGHAAHLAHVAHLDAALEA